MSEFAMREIMIVPWLVLVLCISAMVCAVILIGMQIPKGCDELDIGGNKNDATE